MTKYVVTFLSALLLGLAAMAQPPASKEQQELEKQRQQLKRELEETQQLLDKNRKNTRASLADLRMIERKVELQERLINTISKDINLLDNTIYKSQRDVNKFSAILDTLKRDYAKSMVYAYMNRNNSEFLNFIFSASSFNDAMRRIAYLKSYRTYREMQGENIVRTQEMLRNRINELSGNKQKKTAVLQIQSKEVDILQTEQQKKDRIVAELKAQGKELTNQVNAKRKQMQKVNNAITLAIKRAIEEAKREQAAAKAKAKAAEPVSNPTTGIDKPKKTKKTIENAESNKNVLIFSSEEKALNAKFEQNRGSLPWPVEKGYILLHFGPNKIDNLEIASTSISIATDIGTSVKCIFDGEVVLVNNYDNVQMVVVRHGRYFTGYSNLSSVSVSKGQNVQTGQVIGRVAPNLDGIGAIDLSISNDANVDLNPETWLRRR